MVSLSDLSKDNAKIYRILADLNLTHIGAANELAKNGVESSETSVRRARRVLSQNTPRSPSPHPRSKTLLQISDWQVGCHDEEWILKTAEFARDLQPDIIVHCGDEADNTTLGRWVRGLPGAYEGTLQDEYDKTHDLLKEFRSACPNAEIRLTASNHGDRMTKSLEKYLPGAMSLRCLGQEELLGLEELDIHFDAEPYEVLPDLVYFHGYKEGFTAASTVKKIQDFIALKGKNFLFGHTHRAGLYTSAIGYNWEMTTRFAMNVGHAMRLSEATYVEHGSPIWSQGVGVVHYDGEQLYPELILATDGRFRYQGTSY